MIKKVLIHGSGHKATSWDKTIINMKDNKNILCPNLSTILNGKEASYSNLYFSFADIVTMLMDKLIYVGFH